MIKPYFYRFAFPLLVWFFVYFESIKSMVLVWSNSKTYEHGFIIIPISLWLIWRNKDLIKKTSIQLAWLPIFLLFIPTLLWILAKAANIALFEHISAIVSLQLTIWALVGTPITKIILFPLFFLLFCVPFGEELVPYLQSITADISVFALQLSNIPVYREGLFIAIPNGLFEVARACSGIRFLLSSLALGTLFAYLNFQKWWKFVLFVAFSFVFPIIANGIRAYGIVLIGHLTDMQHATGADHLVYGWVFFSFVIAIIFYTADKFADKQKNDLKSGDQLQTNKQNHLTSVKLPSIVIMSILSIQFFWQNNLTHKSQENLAPITTPDFLTQIQSSNWGVSFSNAQKQILTTTHDKNIQVYFANAVNAPINREFLNYNNQLFDPSIWSIVSNSQTKINSLSTINSLELKNKSGYNKQVYYWYCINDKCTNKQYEVKLLKAFYAITNQSINLSFTAIFADNLKRNEIERLYNVLAHKNKKIS